VSRDVVDAAILFSQAATIAVGAVLLVVGIDCACCTKPMAGPQVPPVIVESRCELPPKPVLPTPRAHRPPEHDGLICYTPEEANKLRERDAKLKQWIREVLARCSREEARDAGSPSAKD